MSDVAVLPSYTEQAPAVAERFRAMHDAGIRRVATGGRAASKLIGQTVEVVGRRKDGREFPLELSLAMWESAGERFFSGIIRDISERKKAEEKLKAVLDILQSKLHRRGIDLKALTIGDPESAAGGAVRQTITLQDGVPQEKAREIVRLIKDSKIRVQASIQENQVRVSGKNRDDLQAIIALVKGKELGIALQFTNYRP